MPRARDLLDDAAGQLAAAGVPSPRVDAELLLAHVAGRPRALLRSGEVGDADAARFRALVGRRAERIPLQHLTGRAPFRHLELSVGPGVFVPRPETELVVDAVLAHVRRCPPTALVAVDLCAGSGALALALATEVPGSRVVAVEVAAPAVGWLQRNVAEHSGPVASAGSSVQVVLADATAVAEPGGALEDLRGGVDVVVSNPPYVPDGAVPRDPEVRDHDPGLALFGGPDGLDVVRPLVAQAARLLRAGGLLVIEHADAQGEQGGPGGVPALLRARPHWTQVEDHADLAGLPRFTTAVRRPEGPPAGGRTDP